MKFLRKSLLSQLVSSFSLLSLITVSVVAFTAYIRAKESLKTSIFDRLSVAVSLKEYELAQWFDGQRQDVLLLSQIPTVRTQATLLANNRNRPQVVAAANNALLTYFQKVIALKPNMQSVSILTRGGIVLFSTNPGQEGKYQPLGNTTTYFEWDETNFVPSFYTSPLTGKVNITFATPILDDTGKRQAVLAVNLNLQSIDNLIREKTGLGQSGETYLIGKVGNQNSFIAGGEAGQLVKSDGIDAAMNGLNGFGLYKNYQKTHVIGVYRWLSRQNVALMAEISQEEAFQPASYLARDIILIGIGSAGILLVVVYLVARQMCQPILVVTDAASDVEANRYKPETLDVVSRRIDELGQLARIFQRMANEVAVREQKLKQEVAELRIEIDQAKKAKQVSEITETDYFKSLQQKAKQLRNKDKPKPELA